MRLALFADGEVGLAITRFLLTHYRQDVAVVVVMEQGPVAELAQASGLPFLIFTSEEQLIAELPPRLDLGLLAWWPKILKDGLLRSVRQGFINTHPSLLPWNRGKHYNFWALVEGAPFGVTLHMVDSGIDSGAIVAQLPLSYDWTDTGETLYRKAQTAMVNLLEQVWPTIRSGRIAVTPQPEGVGSFHQASELDQASRINLDQLYLGRELLNLLRARTFHPHPGCWFEVDGQRYEITIEIRKSE